MYQLTPSPGPGVQVEDEVLDALVKARALIEKPESWAQGTGNRARMCMVQALNHACRNKGYAVAYDLLHEATGDRFVSYWNDAPGRTHSEVLAAFDRAIASRREGERG